VIFSLSTNLVRDFELFSFGIDVITSGNHVWAQKDIQDYLAGAKALGDVLIIAVNDDASVVGLGKRRAVATPLDERVEIVASIKYVDYVTTFSEPTVENLLRLLQPDFHAKGTDYSEETVPERQTVAPMGS
jgi:bifunctional ADP-heptose synthase (sugar kinase/adenylyltransferase)